MNRYSEGSKIYFKDTCSSSLFSMKNPLWDIHDHCRDPFEKANPLLRNILDESSKVSISGLMFTSFHGWSTQRSCWVNAGIQRHANSLKCFNKQMELHSGKQRLWQAHVQDWHRRWADWEVLFVILLTTHSRTTTIVKLTFEIIDFHKGFSVFPLSRWL